ncbi:hypothetical protein H6G36_25375 [Anabaena minutissima FACHB-250]|nr:hypothetical protein [Anabaena minutissima FACHB-250]
MATNIIYPDSEFALKLGFTSDKFLGYLWQDNQRITVSAILSKVPRQGNFTKLVEAIESSGFVLEIPNPSPDMIRYLAKRNFSPFKQWDSQLEEVEVWRRSPAFLGVERQPKPKELWRHFKGGEYQIMEVSNSVWIPDDPVTYWAKDSENEEILAVYHHGYGVTLCKKDGLTAIALPRVLYFPPDDCSMVWARKLDNFLEILGDKNKEVTTNYYRFEKIGENCE